MQTALKGPSALTQVPHAHFGNLTSIDRDEMETLRALRRTIRRYVENDNERRPLAVAVFGPPGAGKSFGVKQIANEVFGGKPCFLEFNLSQFSSAVDLIGAFHQVRDKVLEGAIPVVFWDEFDSNEYAWLQYFLAPLQDGKFQEGQITHALSRCIFVFAGGTSRDFEHFGPLPEPRTMADKEARQTRWENAEHKKADEKNQREFILKKGPDFISRLDAYFNVLGPNQRMQYDFKSGLWDRLDKSDVGFPIRRALLLRSIIGADTDSPLRIETSLLDVLLRVGGYRHGTRSMEKIILPLRGASGETLRRANLPPRTVLNHHLENADEPEQIFSENEKFRSEENLLRVAAAVNETYLRTVEGNPPDSDYLMAFEKLGAWEKATNVAAANRLPEILALAGLCLAEGAATLEEEAEVHRQLQHHLPVLAEREHELWMEFHFLNSWNFSETKDKSKRRHHLLKPFTEPCSELDIKEKDKDYKAILAYPQLAKLAGYKIEFIGVHGSKSFNETS